MQYYPFLTITSATPSPTLPHLLHHTFPASLHLLHSRTFHSRISYTPTFPIHLSPCHTPPLLHLLLLYISSISTPPPPAISYTHRLVSLPFSQPPSSPNFQAQPFTAAAITQWVTLRITPLLSIHIDYLPTHPPTTRNRLRLLRGCA